MAEIEQLAIALVGDADDYYRTLDGTMTRTKTWGGKIGGIATKALGGLFVGAAAGATAAIGAVGAKAFDVSRQTDNAAADMAASLGIPREEAEKFADVAQRVYGENFADSVTDAAGVVEQAFLRIGDVGDTQLQRVSERAIALRDTFEAETGESLSAVETLMENFGLTSDEALDFVTAGFQRGLNRSDDFLDSINEYSTQFREMDADAGQFFSALETGLQGGVLGTDKIADLFKEFRVRVLDGSDATMDAVAALDQFMDRDAEEFLEDLSSGALSQAEAFGMVQEALREVDDQALRMQLGTALLGTQFEDLGDTAVLNVNLANTEMEELAGSADTLDEKYSTFGGFWQGLWRRAVTALTPTTDKILEIANDNLPALENVIDRVGEFLPTALDRIQDSEIIDYLTDDLPEAIGDMRDAWEEDTGGIKTSVENMRTEVGGAFDDLLDDIDDFLDTLDRLLGGDGTDQSQTERGWAGWLSLIVDAVSDATVEMLEHFGNFFSGVTGLLHVFDGIITGDWDRVWSGLQQIFNAFVDSLLIRTESGFPNIRNKIIGFLNDIIRDWNNTVGRLAPGLKIDLLEPTPEMRQQNDRSGGGFDDTGESEMERRRRNRRPPEGRTASVASVTPSGVTAANGGPGAFAPQINVGGVTIRGGSDEDRHKLVNDIMVMLEQEWQMADGQGSSFPAGIAGRV